MRFHSKLYTGELSKRKVNSMKRRIRRGKPRFSIYVITLPLGGNGVLEIYNFNELLQECYLPYLKDLMIVGFAKSRDGANKIVEDIIADIYHQDNEVDIVGFFKMQE